MNLPDRFESSDKTLAELRDSGDLSDLVLSYYEAKEMGLKDEFIQELDLSPFMVSIVEDRIALNIARGQFYDAHVQSGGGDVSFADLEKYLKERGFDEEDVRQARVDYEMEKAIEKAFR